MNKLKIGNIAAYVVGGLLIVNAIFKFIGMENITNLLTGNNLGDKIIIIGIIEMISAVLFIIPATKNLGALLLSAYFGGAIVFHLAYPGPYDPETHGFVVPVAIIGVVYIVSWLRGLKLF